MLSQYRVVLSKPGALGFSSAAWIGRMWLSMTNLGILLLVSATTGRYGLAGAVSAIYVIVGAVAQPFLGRLTDRLGQSRVLLPMVVVHAAGVITLLVLAENGAPTWTLFAVAIPTGAVLPAARVAGAGPLVGAARPRPHARHRLRARVGTRRAGLRTRAGAGHRALHDDRPGRRTADGARVHDHRDGRVRAAAPDRAAVGDLPESTAPPAARSRRSAWSA